MKAKFHSLGILAVLALSASALAADGFTITQKPKKDDKHKYTMKAEADVAGTPAHVVATWIEKTTDVGTDGTFSVEQTQIEMKLTVAGSEQDVPPGPPLTTVFKANGEVAKLVGDSSVATPSSYRMATLGVVFDPGKPVNVGDAWSHDFPADATTGAVKVHADYKLVGEEKIGTFDTLKIQCTVKEQSGDPAASSDGFVWIDKTDGSLVRAQVKWTKAPVPNAPMPVDATILIDRAPA